MYYLMNPGLIAGYMLTINISGMVGVMVLMPRNSLFTRYFFTNWMQSSP